MGKLNYNGDIFYSNRRKRTTPTKRSALSAVKEFGRNFAENVKLVYDLVVNHPTEAFLAGWLAATPVLAITNDADLMGYLRCANTHAVVGVDNYSGDITSKVGLKLIMPLSNTTSTSTHLILNRNDQDILLEGGFAIDATEQQITTGAQIFVDHKKLSGETDVGARIGVEYFVFPLCESDINISLGAVFGMEDIPEYRRGVTASGLLSCYGVFSVYGNSPVSEFDPTIGMTINFIGLTGTNTLLQAAVDSEGATIAGAQTLLIILSGTSSKYQEVIMEAKVKIVKEDKSTVGVSAYYWFW
ncbi:hypothetical protein KO317_04265 [Candidatus Micrarchaeota archaeon]|nr:hypothetical protein [Candidatus Micrarchaeota archaeon]